MCEGKTMTESVSGVQISQPPAASGLNGGSGALKAGHFVVNPYTIRPYSFYDELKKSDNYFNEALQVVASKKLLPNKTKKKTSVFKKILTGVLIVGAGILAYAKRSSIRNFFKKFKK